MDRTAEVEALRRRLYRPDASEEDRARYAAVAQPVAEPVPVPHVARRRSARPLAVLAATAAVAVVVSGVVIAHAASRPAARPVAVAVATARPSASPPPVVLPVHDAGRPAVPVHGTGSMTVALDVSAISLSGGSIAVLLSTKDERPAGWRALRLMTRRDWSEYQQVVRSSPARDRSAATRPDELDYAGDPPRWIRVQAAADATWTLTVVAGR